jgi:ABC-type polysaccharide/polyol phosphate export permease
MGSLANGPGVIYDIDFPRAILPVSNVVSNLVFFSMGLVVVFAILLAVGIYPTPLVVLLPVIMAIQVLFTTGVSLLLALVAVYVQDIQNVMRFVTRALFFLSPALYPVTRIPEGLRGIYMLNPFATFFTSYRDIILYGEIPALDYLAFTLVVSVLVCICGFAIFVHYEPNIAKRV